MRTKKKNDNNNIIYLQVIHISTKKKNNIPSGGTHIDEKK